MTEIKSPEIKSQDVLAAEFGVVPKPVSVERDDIGRLIAVTFETSSPQPDAGSGNRWLVAVDGSDHSLRAVAQAARLASEPRERAGIDLINVQPWLGMKRRKRSFHSAAGRRRRAPVRCSTLRARPGACV